MRYTIILFMVIIVGCAERANEFDNTEEIYSIDTVRINSKNEILDIWGFLSFSDLDSEKKSIFVYNSYNHSIDEIDLEKLEFKKRQKFEKEGPNGTGDIFNEFNVLKGNRLFLKSFEKSGIFDPSGTLLQKIDWRNSIGFNGKKYNDFPKRQILVESDSSFVVGLSYDYENIEVHLDIFSIEENTVERLKLNSKTSYGDLSFRSANSGNIIDPSIEFKYQNEKILLSYEFSNEIVVYDHHDKSLKFIDYNPKLTPKRVIPSKIRIGALEEIQNEINSYYEQVAFYRPEWDSKSKHYFRLSSRTIFSEDIDHNIKPTDKQIKRNKVFLTVFDSEFSLVDELEIKELSEIDNDYFIKDGKLWLLINLDDELGFVRISLSNLLKQ
ncbi:DUF4221 family protein [Algoriphagus boritolerans]|uniref:DUF4221 domain-containing protein n=1 Tax=Algoriphagus boritolerans DSM 17298 = JCM 18970 TaxID=1120964 RepID=A0A1H5YHM4_9BACT|nr:DUF4221 family protein [Algoriphagus boritolerans]SEG23057.1 protein of unknown function [Algoriphagus boritolerans DSM 17298 = JCM 18970]